MVIKYWAGKTQALFIHDKRFYKSQSNIITTLTEKLFLQCNLISKVGWGIEL